LKIADMITFFLFVLSIDGVKIRYTSFVVIHIFDLHIKKQVFIGTASTEISKTSCCAFGE